MADALRGAFNCQHSRVDSFCALAEMVVIFKALGVVEAADAKVITPRRRNTKVKDIVMVTHMQLMRGMAFQ